MGKIQGGETNASSTTSNNYDRAPSISTPDAGTFEGIIAAAIRVDKLGECLQNQIPPEYEGFVSAVNNRGLVLSSANLSHIGKSIFDTDLNPIIPS